MKIINTFLTTKFEGGRHKGVNKSNVIVTKYIV